MTIEDILQNAIPDLGFNLDGCNIPVLAYADDLVLFARRPERLQEKLDGLVASLRSAGMSLNAKKSVGLTIAKDGKHKTMVLLPSIYRAGADEIQLLGPEDTV